MRVSTLVFANDCLKTTALTPSFIKGAGRDSGLPMVNKGGTQFAETVIPVDDRLAVKARLR
jgi:hypothetical protein